MESGSILGLQGWMRQAPVRSPIPIILHLDGKLAAGAGALSHSV